MSGVTMWVLMVCTFNHHTVNGQDSVTMDCPATPYRSYQYWTQCIEAEAFLKSHGLRYPDTVFCREVLR